MKKSIGKLVLVIATLIITPYLQAAIDWNITEGAEAISSGDVYNKVEVFNSAIVDIGGGDISSLNAYDTCTINITGGTISNLGTVPGSSATVNITGGNISVIGPAGGVVNIYGYDFETSNITSDSYTLSGKWGNGLSFQIYMQRTLPSDEYVVLHTPEPATILLFGVSGFRLRRMQENFKQKRLPNKFV